MKNVTSWAAITAAPTGVTGFYGMNVPYPRFAQHRCMTSSQLNSLRLDMKWLQPLAVRPWRR
jgi:magnesium transporter